MGKLEKMFAAEIAAKKGPLCSTCAIMAELPPADRNVLQTEISRTKTDRKRLSARQIVDVLARNGIQASRTSIEKHRRDAHGVE